MFPRPPAPPTTSTNHLDVTSVVYLLNVDHARTTVTFSSPVARPHDCGSIRASKPWPTAKKKRIQTLKSTSGPRPPRYFEVTVTGHVTVGVVPKKYRSTRPLGTAMHSVGYRTHDGDSLGVRRNQEDKVSPVVEPYGPICQPGDVVGCGLDEEANIYFTRNGTFCGTTFAATTAPLYPAVSLRRNGDSATFNFGASPFVFDVRAVPRHAPAATTVTGSAMLALLQSYFVHAGFAKSSRALDAAQGEAVADSSPSWRATLDARADIRAHLVAQEARAALARLQQDFGSVLVAQPTVLVLVHLVEFLALVRASSQTALIFARQVLGPASRLDGVTKDIRELTHRAVGLLAYANVQAAPEAAHFLSRAFREEVAAYVNRSCLPLASPHAPLETLLRQLVAVHQTQVMDVQHGYGEPLSVVPRQTTTHVGH